MAWPQALSPSEAFVCVARGSGISDMWTATPRNTELWQLPGRLVCPLNCEAVSLYTQMSFI